MDKNQKANILDRAISWVSPEFGIRRLRARAALESLGYNAATKGRRTSGWQTTGASANAVISSDLPTLRQLSRDLYRNNPLARKAVNEICTRAIATGIQPKPRTPNKRVNDLIGKAFNAWAEQTGYYQQQELMLRGILVGGESLYRKRTRRKSDVDRFGRPLRVPLALQLMQSEYIDHNKTEPTPTGYIINGIEFDGLGNRIAYWLYDSHPGDNVNTAAWRGGSVFVSRRISASEIEHGFIAEEEGQVRGAPMAAGVFLKHRDLEDTEDADIMRRKVAACLGVAVISPDGSGMGIGMQSTDDPTTGRILEELGPGMIQYLRPGEDIKLIQPPDAPGLTEFMRMVLRFIAAGWNVPYEILANDYSQSNYSSSRMGLVGFREWLIKLQWNVFIPFACDPVYMRFIDLLALQGEIPASMIEDGSAYLKEWGPPKIDVLDREAEAKATRMQLEDGTLTWDQAVMAEGYDPIEQLDGIAEAAKRWRDRGLTPPWEKQGGGAPATAAAGKESNEASGKAKPSAA